MAQVVTAEDIKAPAPIVWRLLTDLERYQEWNPFIKQAIGVIKEGEQIAIDVYLPDSRPQWFRPRVVRVLENREFSWQGQLWFPGLLDACHSFKIMEMSGYSRLVHSEIFTGVLEPFLKAKLERNVVRGFQAMNQALKDAAESIAINTDQQKQETRKIHPVY